jgi:hypothetical protein
LSFKSDKINHKIPDPRLLKEVGDLKISSFYRELRSATKTSAIISGRLFKSVYPSAPEIGEIKV